MTPNDPNATALGAKGGRAGTKAQQEARRRNMLKALAKRHPKSVKIAQELVELERHCINCGDVLHRSKGMKFCDNPSCSHRYEAQK